ncbi:MAG: DUF5320 domain-containing protein, partial [Planctomycetota bacterium]
MPAGDGTGPRGQGPRTGRAAGFCSGFSTPGYANRSTVRSWAGRLAPLVWSGLIAP